MTDNKTYEVTLTVTGELYHTVRARSADDARRIVEAYADTAGWTPGLDSVTDASILNVTELSE